MASVYTVGQINSYIKNMFEQDYLLKKVCVQGEVSNCKYHSSGHIYFTLKDRDAAIACVMFAGYRQGLSFVLKDGLQIQVEGSIEAYVRDGKYQIYVRHITESGVGSLYIRFEALKKKLAQQGMFDNEYKRNIPTMIKTLGVVTASTGAAVRDIITVSKRRNPYIQIILYPAIVQGEEAAESIVKGIRMLEDYGVDAIIVGRGGGSIEDLWAFNEEIVAEAIFNSLVPVISAVGHETDFTIADFVADLRAATPSAAAEMTVTQISELDSYMDKLHGRLQDLVLRKISDERKKCIQLNTRMQSVKPTNRLKEMRMYTISLEDRLQQRMMQNIQKAKHTAELYEERLRCFSPLGRLNNGFGYITNAEGKSITQIDSVHEQDLIHIRLRDGKVSAYVSDVICT